MTTCKLCLKTKPLCKSHIYPEYMYKHCYDDNHSYIDFDAKEDNHNKKRKKGIYEKLLCKECEGHIQKYEDYAKSIFYDDVKEYIRKNNTPYTVHEYEYKKLKLFILSLIWRASVSTINNFSKVNLGKYEETLRNILLNEEYVPVNVFPILIYQMHTGHKLSDGVFLQMYTGKSKFDGKSIFHFIADGLFFFVGIGQVTVQAFKQGASVSPENLRIGYSELSQLHTFVETFDRLKEQGKFSVYEKAHNKAVKRDK